MQVHTECWWSTSPQTWWDLLRPSLKVTRCRGLKKPSYIQFNVAAHSSFPHYLKSFWTLLCCLKLLWPWSLNGNVSVLSPNTINFSSKWCKFIKHDLNLVVELSKSLAFKKGQSITPHLALLNFLSGIEVMAREIVGRCVAYLSPMVKKHSFSSCSKSSNLWSNKKRTCLNRARRTPICKSAWQWWWWPPTLWWFDEAGQVRLGSITKI